MKIDKKKRCLTEVVVRPSEIDPYQIAHHMSYFAWFEVARIDYINSELKELVEEYNLCFDEFQVLKSSCKYINSAKVFEKITIYTNILNISIDKEIIADFKQEIKDNKKGIIIATSKSTVRLKNIESFNKE